MAAFGEWLAGFLATLLTPILKNWWAQHEASQAVAANTAQINSVIQAVSTLQTAKTPQDFINDIKAVGAADNANSK